MIKFKQFAENIKKALRFYDIGVYALSLEETKKYVYKKLMQPFKPKTLPELFALAQTQSVEAIKKRKDCYHYLANSTNVIVLSHFEIFIDEILKDIFQKNPDFIKKNSHHKGKDFNRAIADELYYFHKKNYNQKIKYFKKNFKIDWSRYKNWITNINKWRNDFLHKGIVYAFTNENIITVITVIFEIGIDLENKVRLTFSTKGI